MPTPEEKNESKPKKGRCENCGRPGGRRRKLGARHYVICSDCARAMGVRPTRSRHGRHAHGGRPGRLV
jgi:hypothetical protein